MLALFNLAPFAPGERVVDSSSFIGFVFEIPTLSVDVILKAEGSATEMLVFCFEKKMTQF